MIIDERDSVKAFKQVPGVPGLLPVKQTGDKSISECFANALSILEFSDIPVWCVLRRRDGFVGIAVDNFGKDVRRWTGVQARGPC
jgi:hypothetical protein